MTILLPALAVAFAAICVWLVVRIVNRRERWAKWTAATIGLLVLYVAGMGPLHWLEAHGWLSDSAEVSLRYFYSPLGWVCRHGPREVPRAMFWYLSLWAEVRDD